MRSPDCAHVAQNVISMLKGSASRECFIELPKPTKERFLTQDGFVSCEVYENGRKWTDKIVWRDTEGARRHKAGPTIRFT